MVKDEKMNESITNDKNLNPESVAEDKATTGEKKVSEDKLKTVRKKLQKKDTQKFKSKYFDYYDDIKISDRQDW